MDMKSLYLLVPLAPLAGAVVAGLFGKTVGRRGAHTVTILGVLVAFLASLAIFQDVLAGNTYNGPVYTWLVSGDVRFEVGFLIDRLSVLMMLVVTFVSLMVHLYTIGYMAEDPGYQRFFSYISLFTFSMLMLVMSNNFLQLFFGWEAVGLVSYLLIGFWYTRESAIYANLKAFLVNRVGDFGFLLGIGLVLAWFGTLDYAQVFQAAPQFSNHTISLIPGETWSVLTVICILLFIGAMGKSAQFPLHVWLPDSMEGPTPISALIHAATMVTAGIFMVARMSPLFELSETALSVVMVIGAITALFMAFLGLIQNDIKRVVAYSTLSQLGYMTVALGASAYGAAIFHLMTHAFFKALLFLGAGSVIIAMHHEQDMRHMGGLKKYMPITYWTALIGSLALAGIPPFAGFFSKDAIIEAVGASHLAGSGFAYFAVLAGVFVTAFYSFRMLFMTFHGTERFRQRHHDEHHHDDHHHAVEPKESPWVVTVPLILLAVPSVYAGWVYIEPLLINGWFGGAIVVAPAHDTIGHIAENWHGVVAFVQHGVLALPFWLAVAGIATAYVFYMVRKDLPELVRRKAGILYTILEHKYGFDEFNDWFFAGGARKLGGRLWRWGDVTAIDGWLVNGSARLVGRIAGVVRHLQSGYIYHYAFAMIIGVVVMVTWFVQP
ncbi:MAG: NADH-quinone oxidoreductase subunit L [Betaproteobacteria bacterium]|nr:NADH-quinone oxidoreductase subunit L [Betaproteobacteria bacterium]